MGSPSPIVPFVPVPIGKFTIGQSPIGNPLLEATSPGITRTIRSFLYFEYSDDGDLQAFITAYNLTSQNYLTWFNNLLLPIYTGPFVSGYLLDFVGQGLYGYPRPVLPSGRNQDKGALGTYSPGYILALGTIKRIGPTVFYVTNDDLYRRCITWHFWKADGKYFNVRWLKRRIMRFLTGVNGTAGMVDNSYQISVSFGVGNQVNITIVNGIRTVTGGSLLGRFACGSARGLGSIRSIFQQFAPLQYASTLQAALNDGVLELPFAFTYVVTIRG